MDKLQSSIFEWPQKFEVRLGFSVDASEHPPRYLQVSLGMRVKPARSKRFVAASALH